MTSALVDAFFVTIATEFGDKTFFLATVLAQRHNAMMVFSGAAFALGIMTLCSSAFGLLLPQFLSPLLTDTICALIYLLFGVIMMIEAVGGDASAGEEYKSAKELAESKEMMKSKVQVFLQTFGLIFAAEMGDRSQVSTVSMASRGDFFSTAIGAVSAHMLCTSIAVFCGSFVVKRFSERFLLLCNASLLLFFALHAGMDVVPKHASTWSWSVDSIAQIR